MAHVLYRFGEYRLDPASRELRRNEEELPLPLKAFECLVYLVENRDRAIGRDELIEAVWGKAHLSDSVLDQAIFLARRVLDDTSQEQHTIKTVRGFGYHWVAPVEPEEAPADVARSVAEAGPALRRRSVRLWIALATLVVGTIAAGTVYLWRGSEPGELARKTPTHGEGDIALLLPVTVAEGDRHPWIRLGVMDLIAARLRAAGQPVVPSDTVIALLRDYSAEPETGEIDRLTTTTGAHLVLGAEAEATGKAWRVSLQSLRGPQPSLTTFGEAEEVVEAARIAADRMALSLGLEPAPEPDAEPGLAMLLQRAEAAMLAQQIDMARELIGAADAELRRHPEARLMLARIDVYNNHLDAARAAYEDLLGEPPVEPDPVLRARILNGLGGVHLLHGDYQAAEPVLDEAARLLGSDGQADALAVLGRTEASLGAAVSMQRGVEAAQEHMARSRVALESTADVLGLALLDTYVGLAEVLRERYADALTYFERSAKLFAVMNDIVNELGAHVNMIEAHLALLEPQAALALEPRLDELLAQTITHDLTAFGNLTRVALLDANGRSQAAEDLLAEVLSTVESRTDLPGARTWAFLLHAERLARNEDLTQAGRLAAEVVEQALSYDNVMLDDYLGRAWLILLAAHLAERDLRAAAQISETMSDWSEDSPTRMSKIYAALAQAEVAAAEGRVAAAASAFERALALADSGQSPLRLLQVAERYVPWLLGVEVDGAPDPERALLVAERVARYAERDYRSALLRLRVYHALSLPSAWRTALDRARSLAGDRQIPPELLAAPQTGVM